MRPSATTQFASNNEVCHLQSKLAITLGEPPAKRDSPEQESRGPMLSSIGPFLLRET